MALIMELVVSYFIILKFIRWIIWISIYNSLVKDIIT